MERQQRKLETEALKHKRIINGRVIGHLGALASTVEYRHDLPPLRDPTDIAFQMIKEWAWNTIRDTPPPLPEGLSDADSPPLPTYSRMMATLVDEVNETLFERTVERDQRNDAFIQELKVQIRKFEGLQKDLATKLDALEKLDSSKITSDSYHVGFDSSHVSKVKQQGETSKGDTKIELLNPKSSSDEEDSDSSNNAATPASSEDDQDKVCASPAAKKFAEIPASDYRASHAYITSHPEIVENESDTDGLLVDAYHAMLDGGDTKRARQYVHQALLLQYCRMLGRGGVAVFFRRIVTPGQPAREVFENDVAERFQGICAIAKREGKQRTEKNKAVEQFQLYPVGQNTTIPIQVPPAESEDEEVKKARSVFEQFAPDMRAALESGSLDQVNRALGEMEVSEAEKMVGLLHEVTSCPSFVLPERNHVR